MWKEHLERRERCLKGREVGRAMECIGSERKLGKRGKERHGLGVGVQGNRRGTGCGRINRTENV